MLLNTVKYFFQSYFHQDWMVDYKDSYDALRDFIENENPKKVHELKNELQELLNEQAEIPNDFVYSLGGGYKPSIDGLTTREWMNNLLEKLVQAELNSTFK